MEIIENFLNTPYDYVKLVEYNTLYQMVVPQQAVLHREKNIPFYSDIDPDNKYNYRAPILYLWK